jgi:hypothetical protein
MRNSSEAERRSHKPFVAGSSPASAIVIFESVLVYLSWQRVRLLSGMSLVRVQPPEPNISAESLNLERSVQCTIPKTWKRLPDNSAVPATDRAYPALTRDVVILHCVARRSGSGGAGF